MPATRYYLTRIATPTSPTPNGAWDDTSTLTRGLVRTTRDSNASAGNLLSEVSASATWDILYYVHVSDALTARTISGTLDACLTGLEFNVGAGFVPLLHVWVAQGDTSAVRGVLLSNYVDTHEISSVDNLGVAISQQTLTPVTVLTGDRLVVEQGLRAGNTVTASRSARLYFGGNSAPDQTLGGASANPTWVEFSHDFAAAVAHPTVQAIII